MRTTDSTLKRGYSMAVKTIQNEMLVATAQLDHQHNEACNKEKMRTDEKLKKRRASKADISEPRDLRRHGQVLLDTTDEPLRHRKSNDSTSVRFGEQEQCDIEDTPPSATPQGQGPSSVLNSGKCAIQQCHNATILPDQEVEQVAVDIMADAEEQMKLLVEEVHTEEGVQWDKVAEHMLHTEQAAPAAAQEQGPPPPPQGPPTIEQEEIEQLKGQMEKLQDEIDEQLRSKEEAEAAATEAKHQSEKVEDQALNIANHNKVLRNMLDEFKPPQEKGAQCDGVVDAHETSELENKNAELTAILRTKRQKLKQEKQDLEIANRKNRTWKLKREDSAKRRQNPESNASNQTGK